MNNEADKKYISVICDKMNFSFQKLHDILDNKNVTILKNLINVINSEIAPVAAIVDNPDVHKEYIIEKLKEADKMLNEIINCLGGK